MRKKMTIKNMMKKMMICLSVLTILFSNFSFITPIKATYQEDKEIVSEDSLQESNEQEDEAIIDESNTSEIEEDIHDVSEDSDVKDEHYNLPSIRGPTPLIQDDNEILRDASLFSSRVTLGAKINYSYVVQQLNGQWTSSANTNMIYADGEVAFCIEPGVFLNVNASFTANPVQERTLSIIVYEGWINSSQTVEDYLATQFMVWEAVGGVLKSTSFTAYNSYKAAIQDRINHHNDTPSFSNENYEINVGETIRLTDANSILNRFAIRSTDGLDVTIDGNDLVITGTIDAKDNAQIRLYKFDASCVGSSIIYRPTDGSQAVEKFLLSDPLVIQLKVKVNKFGSANLLKQDIETGNTQGDAQFLDAEYTLYADETIVDPIAGKTYEKNEAIKTVKARVDGTFPTVEKLPLKSYYWKETKAPAGYLLDPAVYKFNLMHEPENATTNLKTSNITVHEQVMKGKVRVFKVAHGGSSGVMEPLPGVEFTYKLKSEVEKLGWDSAKTYATIITDEDGYAETQDLPFGDYLMRETFTPENHKPAPDYTVNVENNGEIIFIPVNNTPYEARLKVIKQDAETGKPITLSNASFKIKNLETNEYVKQWVYFPIPHEIETFTTSSDGSFTTPDTLRFGAYQIEEIKNPDGYVISKEPIKFFITSTAGNTGPDNETPVITVIAKNTPVKGQIVIDKQGEIFKGFDYRQTEFGKLYEPIFEKGLLAGVTYEIIAAEDIITPDQTTWYKKGDVVTELTTDGIHQMVSDKVPLGDYVVKEKASADGYVRDPKEYKVSLTYADEVTPLITHTEEKWNHKQRASITVEKKFEESIFDYDHSAGEDVTFGLFTAEPLTVAGKEEVPTHSLLAVSGLNKDNEVTFGIDFAGKYYVQELATNDNYLLDDTKHYFEFVYAEENGELTELVFPEDNENVVQNELQRGSIEVIKKSNEQPIFSDTENVDIKTPGDLKLNNDHVDSEENLESFYLPGVEFELSTDKEFENILQTKITDENGKIVFDDLEVGTYYVRESKTLEYYVLDKTVHNILIEKDGQVETLEVTNDVRRSSILVNKRDVSTHKLLPFAEFTLYADKECTKILAVQQATVGGTATFDDLLNGTYYVKETGAPEGYLLSDEVVEVIVDSNEPPKTYTIDYYDEMMPIIVNTSDHTNLNWLCFLLFSSCCVFVGTDIMKRRKQHGREED